VVLRVQCGQNLMPNGMMFHILDDFLILAPTFDMCKRYLQEFLAICDKIGILMAPEKTMGPSTCLTFLGIELNTVQKVARLPNDNIEINQKFLPNFQILFHRSTFNLILW
jgi:hypothetical protein